MPQPSAFIRVAISVEENIFSLFAFSTFNILPFRGRIAWVLRSLPCLAEPPAESPSTKNISHLAGSFSWQSASFPGSPAMSNAPLRLVISLAFLAASLALAESSIFEIMLLASLGFSIKNSCSALFKRDSTTPFTSDETSLSFVCAENFGSGCFIESTAVIPSRQSSPVTAVSPLAPSFSM